jgi:DNA processing protein
MDRIAPGAPGYPALLAAVSSPPTLWLRGRLVADDALAVAIVGARRATAYGLHVAEQIAGDLAARGVTIVSRFARGIDTAAHEGALAAGGRTIAVLGSGIDVVYPPENLALAGRIERSGALVSQFPPGMPPRAGHFPARNRTLAGLALGVLVVEAAERSGALITAGFAGDLGREVFAIPGRITSAPSAGANRLIQDGAKLVTQWLDVVSELPQPWRRAVRGRAMLDGAPATPDAESDEGRMLALLAPDEPQHIERLIARAGLTPARVAATLVTLELGGWARQLSGQRWVSVKAGARRA